MDDSCALQYFYFQLGERNDIINYLKNFLRSRTYLKTKPSLGNIFDLSLQNTLREFQQYKRQQITGFFNHETYAAIGAEMGEKGISAMRMSSLNNANEVLWWLLRGKKGVEPTFYLKKPSPVEKTNGNSQDEKIDIDLARLLTKDGIVRAAAISAQSRASDPFGNSHFNLADGKVYTIHVYGDLTGTAVTGFYLPTFFNKPIYDGKDTVIATTDRGEVLGIAHIRISSQAELDKNYNQNILNSKGSRYIGEIGGTGGDGGCYRHSHIHFFPNAASRRFIKILKDKGLDPTHRDTKHLIDVRELLKR